MEHEELAGGDAKASEGINRLQGLAIEYPDAARASARGVQEALLGIAGERDARRGLPVAAAFADGLAPAIDPGLADELAVDGENLNTLPAPIGGIDQAVVRHLHAVQRAELLRAGIVRLEILGGNAIGIAPGSAGSGTAFACGARLGIVQWHVSESPPHPFEGAGLGIEDDDALVAVAVGDEQLVRLRIDEHI